MKQLRQFYAQTSKKSFLTMATIVLLLCDALVISYIYIKFNNYDFFQKTLGTALAINGLSFEYAGPEFVASMFQLFHRTLVISLGLAALYHFINYYCWWKGMKFAATYIKILTSVGGPLMIIWGFGMLSSGSNLGLVFLLFGSALFALFPGIRHHFPS